MSHAYKYISQAPGHIRIDMSGNIVEFLITNVNDTEREQLEIFLEESMNGISWESAYVNASEFELLLYREGSRDVLNAEIEKVKNWILDKRKKYRLSVRR